MHHYMNGSDGPLSSVHGPTLPADASLATASVPGGWVQGDSSAGQQPTSAEAAGGHPPLSTCGPFVVGPYRVHLQPAASPAEDSLRRQHLMNTLLAQAPDYGAALFEQCNDKMACFARLNRVDLASILTDSSPGLLLDSLWSAYQQQVQQDHAADGQQQLGQPRPLQDQQQHQNQQTHEQRQQEHIVYHPSVWQQQEQQLIAEDDVYYPPPPQQEQEQLQEHVGYQHWLQQQQPHDSNHSQQDPGLAQSVQQQSSDAAAVIKVAGPRDLSPAAAAAFESALPIGLLPDSWQNLPKWGALEMECRFTVAGSDRSAIQDLRTRFKQAREAAIAATQAGRPQQQQSMGSYADHQEGHVSSSSNGLAPRVKSPSVSASATAAASAAAAAAAYGTQPKPEANASNGSRPRSSGRGKSRSNVRASPFRPQHVKLHSSRGNSAESLNSLDAGRRERLVTALRSKAPEYAAALPQQEEKLAELSRIVSSDLDVILQQQQPDQALEDVYRHLCRTRGVGGSQQYHPCAATVKPCDVPLQLRQQFEGSLPPGALPEFWMTFQSWQQLESKVNINAFGLSFRHPSRVEEVKTAFSRAVSEIIEAVVEELRLQPPPGLQRQGQQQQEPEPCDLPGDLADRFVAAFPDGWLPGDWQQYCSWPDLFEQVHVLAWRKDKKKRQDIKQLCTDAKQAVILEYAGSTGHQQHNGQQQCAEDYSALADTSAELNGSDFEGQQQGPGQQQQQSRQRHNSVRPCDLLPEFASQFAAAAEGRLPDDWQRYDSWGSLEALISVVNCCEHNPSEAHRRFGAAKMAACDAYEGWLQLQQQPPAALDNHSSTHTARRQQGAKRTVAPCELPAAAASLLESLVPAGVLPANWQAYPTWSDLDVAVCYTAGGTDPSAVNDSIRRFKEAKQAALTAAADGCNHSANGVRQLQQQQQQVASQADTSSVTTGPNSNRVPAGAAAPPRPSVSWAQAAAGTNQDAAGPGPAATAQPRAPLGEGHALGGTAAVPAQQPISRAVNGGARSPTNPSQRSNTSTSNTEAISNSRPRSSSASAVSGPASSCRDAPAAAAKAPANCKYVPAYDPVCSKCGARGHAGEQCSTPYCPSCTQWGHADGIDCLSACHHCGRIHQSAGYVRCEEKGCDNCLLRGHRRFECPHIMCAYCKCYGHSSRDCRACRECREWGHTAEQCPGFCRKCDVPGHRTADCRVKRCGQCGKAGCVVGMCSGFAAPSSSSKVGRGRGSSKSAAGTSAVAAAGLFDPSQVSFDVADSAEQEHERRQLLVSKLMEVPELEEYACALLTEDAAEKLAVLATISAADLSLILQQQKPAGLLDQIRSMQAAAAARKPAPAVAAAGHISRKDQLSQHHHGVIQQQGGTTIMPCDLGPKHRQILEDRLPADSLPADWFENDTWIELEREFIECFKATHDRGSGVRLQERRIAFRRARQYVQAVAAGTIPEQQLQQWSDSPGRQEQTDHDEQQDRKLKPGANKARDGPPATPQRWQQPQKQEAAVRDGWPVLDKDQHDPPASNDGWPVVEHGQHSEPASGDGWVVDEQPQPVAPREPAWGRKLNLGQPETTQQQQQQIGDQIDQVYHSAEPLQQDPADAILVHAVSPDAAVPAAPQPAGDSHFGQQQPEHQQHSVALPAYTAAGAGVAVMPVISQSAPVHSLHFPHHQMQQQELQLGMSTQQQQQQGPAAAAKVLGPRDLTPAAAAAFEASLPPGLLPDNWRSLPKWGLFEMECKFTVAGSDREVIQDLRTRFKQAKEAAKAHTQAEWAGIAQPPLQEQQQQQQQQQAPLQVPQQHGQVVRGPPPGFAPTMAPTSTAALVAPSPIYVLGHQALQQQQQQRHAEPVMGIPVCSMGIPTGSLYPPSYPPSVATSTAAVHVPAHPSRLMLHPAMMPQYATMQHIGSPAQHIPAAAVPAAAVYAAAMVTPHGVAAGHPGTHMTAVSHGPAGSSAAPTAAAGVGSDEDLDDILNLCGAQDG